MIEDDAQTRGTHPFALAVAVVSDAVEDLAHRATWSMQLGECRQALIELTCLTSQLAAVEHAVVVQAETLAPRETGDMWARATRKTRAEARARVRLATKVDAAHPALGAGMAAGAVSTEQAKVILEAIEAIKEHPEHQPACEAHLVGLAAEHDVKELKVLGRRVLEIVDPAAAEAHEAELLAQEEAQAKASARFTMGSDGHGKVHGRFSVPEVYGDLLRRALDGLAAPGHVRSGGEEWVVDKPTPERLGQAFCDYIEGYEQSKLPDSVQLVITCTIEDLKAAFDLTDDHPDGHGPGATSDSGQRFSPGELRRLACTHGILPAVMDSDSEVLDLGRRVRLATRKQRTALTVTQRHCQHHGCDIPARWCHVHHQQPWSLNGHTDLKGLQLLCPRHHRATHTAVTSYPLRT